MPLRFTKGQIHGAQCFAPASWRLLAPASCAQPLPPAESPNLSSSLLHWPHPRLGRVCPAAVGPVASLNKLTAAASHQPPELTAGQLVTSAYLFFQEGYQDGPALSWQFSGRVGGHPHLLHHRLQRPIHGPGQRR